MALDLVLVDLADIVLEEDLEADVLIKYVDIRGIKSLILNLGIKDFFL